MKIENAHNGLKWLRVFLKGHYYTSVLLKRFFSRTTVTIHNTYAYDSVQNKYAYVTDTGFLGCFAGCKFKPPNLPTIQTTTLWKHQIPYLLLF
jgi:hypothetical protein